MSCDINYWPGNASSATASMSLQQRGHICAAVALSHEKSHAVNVRQKSELPRHTTQKSLEVDQTLSLAGGVGSGNETKGKGAERKILNGGAEF